MPYCKNCGEKVPEDATYCPNCGTAVAITATAISKPVLANWGERFVAWLIDMVILGIITTPLNWFVSWTLLPWMPSYFKFIPFVDLGLSNVIFFIYWTLIEGNNGQSIGKMVIRIRVTRSDGKRLDLVQAAIESIGKAFLLPLDCIIGWIFFPTKNQRLFSYISDTVVVHI